MGMPTTYICRLLIMAWAAAVFPLPCSSQEVDAPSRYKKFLLAAGNASLGALTTVAGQLIRGKRIDRRATVQGAVGGGLVFAGKVIVARSSSSTNLIGRELAAIGSSGIQNAAAGRGFADRLSLPWGPVRFHIDRLPQARLSVKLDLAASVATIVALADDELTFDAERSLINGVAVFEVDSAKRSGGLGGSHSGGVIQFRSKTPYETAGPSTIRRIMGHELVHIVQSDFLFNAWTEPAESRVLGWSSVGRAVYRYVDLGLNVPLSSALNSLVSYERRPWEREAFTLAVRR